MDKIYKCTSLLISESQEVIEKFFTLSDSLEAAREHRSNIFDALDYLIDVSVDSILIDTAIGEDDVLKFLNHIYDDIENLNTPIIIISNQQDYDLLADKLSQFNVVSILSNPTWYIQVMKLFTLLKAQKLELSLTKHSLIQSEGRGVIDALTGAYNRYGAEDIFNKLTSRVKAYDEPFCTIMLDIDHFKSVNDTYGHDIGDEVLKGFSKLIKKSIRKDDALVRLGGEEFVIFISNIDINIAVRNAEMMREMIEATTHSSKHLDVTASFGVVQYRVNEELESLLKRSDELLYDAKRAGRNMVISVKHTE